MWWSERAISNPLLIAEGSLIYNSLSAGRGFLIFLTTTGVPLSQVSTQMANIIMSSGWSYNSHTKLLYAFSQPLGKMFSTTQRLRLRADHTEIANKTLHVLEMIWMGCSWMLGHVVHVPEICTLFVSHGGSESGLWLLSQLTFEWLERRGNAVQAQSHRAQLSWSQPF